MARLFQPVVASDVPTAPQNTRTKFDRPAAAGTFSAGWPDRMMAVSGTKKSPVGMPCSRVGSTSV
ncbi:hypothetical protein D3C79_1076360 [compost metagenome]